jgi:hypothetical protein
MLLIGAINVGIGLCSYEPPTEPQRIELHLPALHDAGLDARGTLGIGQIPADVMRAFTVRYPRTIPAGAETDGTSYVVILPPGAPHTRATFRADGTFVSED